MNALVEARDIYKSFGSCQALRGVSFKIESGKIVGLVGENGAGKSTAMNILYGRYGSDSGDILWNGKPRLGMVHQHFALSESHSVIENIIVSTHQKPWLGVHRKKTIQRLTERCRELGLGEFSWHEKVKNLSVGEQQRLEIFKALLKEPQLLILDEPTAVLTPQEVKSFFESVRRFKAQGMAVVIITHKLKEILSLTDHVYVFRQGQNVLDAPTSSVQMDDLASAMIGQRYHSENHQKASSRGPRLLQIEGLEVEESGRHLKIDHLDIHVGETVGLAGVEGNGQDLLVQALMTPQNFKRRIGSVLFKERNLLHLSTREILSLGFRSLPEDRLRFGALPQKSALENFILGQEDLFKKSLWLDWRKAQSSAREKFKEFDVRPLALEQIFKTFSGGNQQKIVVARELLGDPKFLLAPHPTRGVDIKAAQMIRSRIRKVSENGASFVISSDLDELFEICDRIYVIYKGQILQSFSRQEFSEEKIGAAMAGGLR